MCISYIAPCIGKSTHGGIKKFIPTYKGTRLGRTHCGIIAANKQTENKRQRTLPKSSSSGSTLRCERCDGLGHRSDFCTQYRYPREDHIDAVAKGRMPHMDGEIHARVSRRRMNGSRAYCVNGLDFMLGDATSENNNCLIDSLCQVLYDQAGIRSEMQLSLIHI